MARGGRARLGEDGVEIVAGDITERRLGLGAADWERLTDARHARLPPRRDLRPRRAASSSPQRVNVDGTGNVLELCRAAKRLERHAYVSTAYVAGDRHGVVYEHELVLGQGFKNHYESTKFQAEVWVREMMDRDPDDDPAPRDRRRGLQDGRDGEVRRAVLHAAHDRARASARPRRRAVRRRRREVQRRPRRLRGRRDHAGRLPRGPVDKTLHLVDPEPLSAAQLVTTLSRAYAGRDPQGRVPPGLVAAGLRRRSCADYFGGTPRESVAYINHAVTFDTRSAADLGVVPPRFGEYVDAMVGYFKLNEARTP